MPTQDNSLPPETANMDANGVFMPPSLTPSEPLKFPVSSGEAPIKDNPQVRMDKRNQARRRSDLEMQANQPDFKKMLHPSKNTSLRDLYDTEFLKNPLQEAMKRDLRIGITKDAYLSKEMRSVLERFDRAVRVKKNELPVDIHILTEEEQPVVAKSIEEVSAADMDEALQDVVVEETQPGDELDEIILEESPSSETDNLPNLKELAELGLDLKNPEDSELKS
jgi:hypothetical protein